jgi:probable O-glycosylation ligase (exosortase A-associated)
VRDVLLLVLTSLASLLALTQPAVGMLAFVGLSVLGPHSLTWGIAYAFPHAQVVGLATIIGFLFWREAKRFPTGRESRLMLVLWALFGLSTVMAIRPEPAMDQFILVSKLLLMMFLCTAIVNTPDRLHALVRVIALSLGFYGAKLGLFVLRTGAEAPVFGPADSYLYGENAIGMALAANLPLLVYLWRVERIRWFRWTVAAMACLSYPAVVGSHSRGAWLALAAVSLVLILRSRRPVVVIGLVMTLAVIGGAWIAGRLVSERVETRFDQLVDYEADGSAQSRFWNWEFCARVGLARPLFGGGFELYSPEAYRHFFPDFLERWPGKVWSCHSMWMTILAEHGVTGFLLWIGVLISCWRSLRRLHREARRDESNVRLAELAQALSTVLVAFVVAGTFLDVAYFELLYQVIAMVIITGALWQKKASHPIVSEPAPLATAVR